MPTDNEWSKGNRDCNQHNAREADLTRAALVLCELHDSTRPHACSSMKDFPIGIHRSLISYPR